MTEAMTITVTALIRHGLTALAGYLVAHGIISNGMQEQVVGYGIGIIGIIWSLGQKLGGKGWSSVLRYIADLIDEPPTKALGAVLVALALLAPAPADARPRSRAVASVAISTPSDIWSQIQSASLADLEYAAALATAANTPGSLSRAKCWNEWSNLIKAQTGANASVNGMKLEGNLVPFTRAEQMAQFADALQTDSPFMQACSPVAQKLKVQVFSLVGLLLKGGLSLSAFGL